MSLVQQPDADNQMITTETRTLGWARAKLPRVGVVIFNYNGKALAEQCIRSFESTYPNKEIILLDNVSTDGSFEYLRSVLRA